MHPHGDVALLHHAHLLRRPQRVLQDVLALVHRQIVVFRERGGFALAVDLLVGRAPRRRRDDGAYAAAQEQTPGGRGGVVRGIVRVLVAHGEDLRVRAVLGDQPRRASALC